MEEIEDPLVRKVRC